MAGSARRAKARMSHARPNVMAINPAAQKMSVGSAVCQAMTRAAILDPNPPMMRVRGSLNSEATSDV